MHTHYSNLKVTEQAPLEVIKAAYAALAKKHHPDQNPHDPDAVRRMQIINAAYSILADPVKRSAYDAMLKSTRGAPNPVDERPHKRAHAQYTAAQENRTARDNEAPTGSPPTKWGQYIKILAFSGLTLFGFYMCADPPKRRDTSATRFYPKPPQDTPALKSVNPITAESTSTDSKQIEHYKPRPATVPESIIPKAQNPAYVRSATDPNGWPWPLGPTYLFKSDQYAGGGSASVEVDNAKNNSDFHLKLVVKFKDRDMVAREFYIPEHSSFALDGVMAGTYYVRFRDLKSGLISKTEHFLLESGSRLSLTLFTVTNGNMETETITEQEF